MKILYLAQTFPPEPGATKRPARLAAQWVRAGHEVTVVTALPSYPLGRRLPAYRGRVFVREQIDGVDVLRVPTIESANVGLGRRALAFASFATSATLTGLLQDRPDLVIGSIPKPGTELAALALARTYACPLVLEVRDVLPHSIARVGMLPDSLGLRALSSAYAAIYRSAKLLAVTEEAAADMLAALGVRRDAIVMWPHAWDIEDLGDEQGGQRVRAQLGWERAFVIAYVGSFSPYYRVEQMVAAARRLRERLPELRLLLVGTGASYASVAAAADGLANVHLAGGVEPSAVGPYLHAADLFLWPTINDDPLGGTKIVEYLAVGRPVLALEGILASGHAGSAGAALERIGAGHGVAIDDPDAIDDALIAWAHDAERRRLAADKARAHVRERERSRVAATALEHLRSVTRPSA